MKESLFEQGAARVETADSPSVAAPVQSGSVPMRREEANAPAHRGAPMDVSLIPSNLTPEQLIFVAIHQGIDPDALDKLVSLQERMNKTRAEKAFNAALVRFKELCPAIKKNKTANIKMESGGSYAFTYAEIDQIAMTADPFLQECGFSYMWNQSATANSVTETCILMHDGGHQRESSFTVPTENKSGATPQQKFGGASTFAQRRSFAAVLGLVTTDKDFERSTVDPTKVSDDQATAIEDKIREVGRGDDKARFLAYMKVEKVADIRAADYAKAMKSLDKLGRENARKGGSES